MMDVSSLMRSQAQAQTQAIVAIVLPLILGVVGGILVYFLFLNKKNEGKFKGFVGWLYEFLSFKKMFLETLLKITYLILAITISIYSLFLIGKNFLSFLLVLVLGNIIIRVMYEFSLVLLVICKNTTEIAKNTKKSEKKD